MADILLTALAYVATDFKLSRRPREGQVNSITNLDNISLQWAKTSLNRTLSFLD
jgi:hypothetical protein